MLTRDSQGTHDATNRPPVAQRSFFWSELQETRQLELRKTQRQFSEGPRREDRAVVSDGQCSLLVSFGRVEPARRFC